LSRWSVLALLAFAACRADREAPIPEPPKPEAPQLESSEQPEAPPPQAGSEEASFRHIDVKTLKQRLDEGWDPFVLDVRGPEEVAAASLPFTDRVEPHAGVARIAAELPRDRVEGVGERPRLAVDGERAAVEADDRARLDAEERPAAEALPLLGGLQQERRPVAAQLEVGRDGRLAVVDEGVADRDDGVLARERAHLLQRRADLGLSGDGH